MDRTIVEIRLMVEEDLEEVSRIERENFSVPWSKNGFLDALQQDNYCFLSAVLDGKIVGYCGMQQVLDEADITNVAIDGKYRQGGIGYQMMLELLREGKRRGVEAFTLEVRESNQPARNLYQKLGFEDCGIRKNFYDKPKEDAVIMWKR